MYVLEGEMIRRDRPKGPRGKWICGFMKNKKLGKNRKASLLLVPVCVRIEKKNGEFGMWVGEWVVNVDGGTRKGWDGMGWGGREVKGREAKEAIKVWGKLKIRTSRLGPSPSRCEIREGEMAGSLCVLSVEEQNCRCPMCFSMRKGSLGGGANGEWGQSE
jgi:hypothetical protein